ncbi:MAG: TIGR01841 family phasin [Burkholderiaceae bacterium]|nr:TIGR01841 family phasin [Burkholderiaceae bacterium]
MSNPEDLMKMHSDAIKASSAAAAKTLEGFQKLAALNLQTSKAALEQSQEQIKALLAAKDAKLLSDLVTSFAQPAPEQFTTYAKAVYAISKDTSTDLASMVEKQVAAGNEQLHAAIEALAKNAPAGTEGSMNFVKQSLAAANKAYDQLNAATRQFVEMAEANTQGAVKAASARKR